MVSVRFSDKNDSGRVEMWTSVSPKCDPGRAEKWTSVSPRNGSGRAEKRASGSPCREVVYGVIGIPDVGRDALPLQRDERGVRGVGAQHRVAERVDRGEDDVPRGAGIIRRCRPIGTDG